MGGYDNRNYWWRRLLGMDRTSGMKAVLCKLGRGIKNVLLTRRMPGGLVSWRLLFPSADPCIQAHRAMWRYALHPRLPVPLAIAVEVFVWLRWLLWCAWIDSWASVRHHGADARAAENMGYVQQFFCVIRLALLHSISPWDAYTLQLYRPQQRKLLWRYVYGHEPYHQWFSVQWRSAGRTDWLAATSLLGDKVQLTAYLQQLGLPAAEIFEVVPQGKMPDFARWLAQYPALFCKTRSGARGEGAFSVESGKEGKNFTAHLHRQTGPDQTATPAQVEQLLATADYLIQPRLENHPSLAALNNNGELFELRVITENDEGVAGIHSAFLYTAVRGKDGDRDWLFFPVSPLSGTVLSPPAGAIPQRCSDYSATVLAALHDQHLPDWPVIREAVLKAHQGVLCGAATIAWDVVMTPDGPRILEGNSGWGVVVPQMLSGPFLPAS